MHFFTRVVSEHPATAPLGGAADIRPIDLVLEVFILLDVPGDPAYCDHSEESAHDELYNVLP
jgi:hypothetical protein